MTIAPADAKKDPLEARAGTLTWGAAATCVLFLLWMGLGWDFIRSKDSYVGKKTDYYSSQVHGFLSGHLYMDRDPYPEWANPDPAVRGRAPYLLDASYYKGRYYLYFGVTPAFVFLLPYAWLTGSDLHPRYVIALCAALGFLFSVAILRMAERDHFKRLGPLCRFSAVALLAFASAVPSLLTWAKFYEVAIASGYACTMGGAFWIYRAISGRGRTRLQLAIASVCFGLAVGCRPNLILNIPVLAVAAWLVARRQRERGPILGEALANGIAALAPAAFVGGLLAVYNYERFGSPFEFGVTYCMNSFMQGGKPLFSTAYMWPNIHWYYLTPPAISPYFPYVFPEEAYFGPAVYRGGEAIHGQFVVFILFLFAAAVALLVRKRLSIGRLGSYLALLAWMFLGVFMAIVAIGFRGDRYAVDFQAPLTLGVVLLAAAIGTALGEGLGQRLWRAAFGFLAMLAVGFNIFAGIQEFNAFHDIRTTTYHTLESLGNYPAYWLEKTGLLSYGPIELKVVFPADLIGTSTEPLFSAGTPESTDSLYAVENFSGKQIELLGDHSNYGGPRSEPIAITPGQTYTLKIDMGALYPPRGPPFTAGFKVSQGHHIKTRIHVELDGKTVLERRMNSYDAPPWSLHMGSNLVTMNPFKTKFSGRILSMRRLPIEITPEANSDGLWRIRCVVPQGEPNANFPLLSSGVAGAGTLVVLSALPDDQIRFGIDEWAYGGSVSAPIKSKPGTVHVVEIFIGPLAAAEKWPAEWGISPQNFGHLGQSLVAWLDGRQVWTTELLRPIDPAESAFEVGGNSQGFTSAQEDFTGMIRSEPYAPAEAHEFLERNLHNK
jgi:hypothetical protein